MTNHWQAPQLAQLAELTGSVAACLDGMWCVLRRKVPPSAGDVITFICDTRISKLLQLPARSLRSHNYCLVTHTDPAHVGLASTCHAHRVPSLIQIAGSQRQEQEQEQEQERELVQEKATGSQSA